MSANRKVTPSSLLRKKRRGEKITLLTAYDFPIAMFINQAGVDIILVSDAVGTVGNGRPEAVSVSVDEMIYHTKIVSRAVQSAMVIGDLPFLSYQASIEEAVRNAGRFIKEAGASAVKIEGGAEVADHIRAMTRSDIPVMAHIGLTPQSIHRMGGYKVQGKTKESAKRLLEEAHIAEDAGAFSLLLEAIPMGLAKKISKELSIPTIGIGAGPHCDGQVLVLHDVLGLFDRFLPKFAKRYTFLREEALRAIKAYRQEVEEEIFPSKDHSFK